jgi:hypothetical protein
MKALKIFQLTLFLDALSMKVASVGHDTEFYGAPEKVYVKLPGCCHYERTK